MSIADHQDADLSSEIQIAMKLLETDQEAGIDALTKLCEKAIANENIAATALAARQIGRWYLIHHRLNDALKYIHIAIEHYRLLKDELALGSQYNNLGIAYFEKGMNKEAVEAHLQAIKIRETQDNSKALATSLMNLGGVYVKLEHYTEALDALSHAARVFEQLEEDENLANTLYKQGIIFALEDHPADALEKFMEALVKSNPSKNPVLHISICNSLGYVNVTQRNFAVADKYLQRALKLSREVGYKEGEITSLTNLCELFLAEDKLDLVLEHAKEALSLGLEDQYDANTSAYVAEATVYIRQGQYEKAEHNLIIALNLVNKHLLKFQKRAVLQELVTVYEKLGDFAKAFQYQKEYQQLMHSHYEMRIDRKLAESKYSAERERKEKEAALERQKKLEVQKERDVADGLLKNILPAEIAQELKDKGSADAKLFDPVSVLITDFKDFTKVSERLSPKELVAELHTCFSAFDNIIKQNGLEKIKTVGDAYLAVAGLPIQQDDHALRAVKAALDIQHFMQERFQLLGENTFKIRIGIHSGQVIGGIVGTTKFAYDIWGDTVNVAARMEQNSEPGKINISGATFELVHSLFNCEYRGEIEAKNKGKMKMYFVKA